MSKYERSISLKSIVLTIVRRYKVLLLFFVPVSLAVVVVTQTMLSKQWSSTTSFAWNKTAAFSQVTYNLGRDAIVSETNIANTVRALAVNSLEHKPVTFADGKAIEASDIASNLSFTPWSSTNFYITVTLKSVDNTIVQPVLKELAEQSIEYLKESEATKANYNLVSIYKSPSEAVRDDDVDKYMFIGLAAAAVLALGIAFIDEIVSDEVYDMKDVELMGIPSYDLTVTIGGAN